MIFIVFLSHFYKTKLILKVKKKVLSNKFKAC